MPCHNASHTHEWPRSGALSIAKCESRCSFCTSEKDYKPASALRKHVLTHIKNDKMPLTVEKSTGGRSRLQTTTNVPKGNNQPELPPSHSEEPEAIAATNLAIEQADVEGGTTRHVDKSWKSLRDTFATRAVKYSEQVAMIVNCIQSVEEAVDLLKYIGSGQRLFQQVLDFLKIHMVEIGSKHWSTWLKEPRYDDRWFWYQIEQSFLAFLKIEQGMIQEVFYATVFFLVTEAIMYDSSGSTSPGPVPEETDGNSSTPGHVFRSDRPIVIVLEEPKQKMYDLLDDAYGINLFGDLRGLDPGDRLPNWDFLIVANIVPKSDTVIKLAEDDERLKTVMDFMFKLARFLLSKK